MKVGHQYNSCYNDMVNCFVSFAAHFFKACDLALKSLYIHREHYSQESMDHASVLYKTVINVVFHKNFRKVKWTSER